MSVDFVVLESKVDSYRNKLNTVEVGDEKELAKNDFSSLDD